MTPEEIEQMREDRDEWRDTARANASRIKLLEAEVQRLIAGRDAMRSAADEAQSNAEEWARKCSAADHRVDIAREEALRLRGALRDLADASQLEWPTDWPEGQDPLSRARAALNDGGDNAA